MKSGLPAFLFHHESGSKELIGNLKSEITQNPEIISRTSSASIPI